MLAEVFKNNLAFDGHGNVAFLLLFSSALSCVISSLPVVPICCYVTGICHAGERLRRTVNVTALALLFSNSYGGMVTHYGGRQVRSSLAWVTTILNPGGWWCGTDDINLPGAYHPRRVVVNMLIGWNML